MNTNSMFCDLSKHIESSRDMLEGGNKWGLATPPHLITKHEGIVVKGQSGPADNHTLAEDSDPNAVYKIAAGHTFTVVLTTKETACVLSTSKQPGVTNTHSVWASCTSFSTESILARFC